MLFNVLFKKKKNILKLWWLFYRLIITLEHSDCKTDTWKINLHYFNESSSFDNKLVFQYFQNKIITF